jgi:CTP:molybdopterin cytidylyltransferase MocA
VIGAVLLAAGSARRFGGGKLTAPIDGEAIVHRAARTLIEGGLAPVHVVLRPNDADVRDALADLAPAFVVCADHATGMSASLRAGIAALPPETTAALVALADQPAVDPAVIRALVAAFADGSSAIAAPRYGGVLANPVLFARSVFRELLALEGDVGARSVVLKDAARVRWLDVDAPVPADVDTLEDLRTLRARGAVSQREGGAG